MKFAGMVTLYNPTKRNIENIMSYIDGLDVVYLIDNSSFDNSNLLFNSKKIKYIPNLDNLGIAEALNIACKKAISDGYKWILTMDQDSILTLDALKKMQKYTKENDMSNVGIISPYHCILTTESKPSQLVEEKMDVMTSGNLLNLEIYEKIGGFKSWLFIDGVDIEYCLNLNINGFKVLRLNNVLMDHNLGDATCHKFLGREIICSNHNAIRRYYMVRNNLYIRDMYGSIYPDYCKFLIDVQKGQLKRVAFFEKNKIKKLKLMFKGYRNYKKGIKGKLII